MTDAGDDVPRTEVTRRAFLQGAGIAAASLATPLAVLGDETARGGAPAVVGPGPVELDFRINGAARRVSVEPSVTLLDMVRDRLDLTGSKRVCDRGSCGACSMLVDGVLVNACSTLAIDAAGKEILTIEGIGSPENLSPLQRAFLECDALQCGFCTPGMVVACTALLARNPAPTRAEIAEGIAGNICRCGTYQNIFEAVELAASRGRGSGGR